MSLYIVKFGGSVLNGSDGFRKAADYIVDKNRSKNGYSQMAIAVVSAPFGATNILHDIYENRKDDKARSEKMDELRGIYNRIIWGLPNFLAESAKEKIKERRGFLKEHANAGARDAIIGSGEEDSCILLCYNIEAIGLDAKGVAGSEAGFLINRNGTINMEKSRKGLKAMLRDLGNKKILVVGGYLGRSVDSNDYKTGTRNSTDAFAVAVADAANAKNIEIIKNVSGVYRVEEQYGNYGLLDKLSYDEAIKMTWRGSPVIHPEAVKIARKKRKPIIIKDMKSTGTTISEESQTTAKRPVAAIVTSDRPMFTIIDSTMDLEESTGYLADVALFEAERGHSIGVEACDAGIISYTISIGDVKTKKAPEESIDNNITELREYLKARGREPSQINGDAVGTITVVGDAMKERRGTLEEIFGIVRRSGVSVRSAVQSDEKYMPPSISFAVDSDKLETTVKALCEELFK
ncbi:MAG: hypothetical protein NT129_05900 [Candidatus Aenigmarchaeota archaeon]|nr:hypothetical protein [Candidatus Aenigmarchaeota archaeon]